MKGKSAWLITWEGKENEIPDRPKIIATLSPRLGEQNIKLILRVLFCSEYPFTLSEKLAMGTATRKEMPNLLKQGSSNGYSTFYYGYLWHSYLYARRVKKLACKESPKNLGECTLLWTELPRYKYDDENIYNEPKLVVPERQESYTHTQKFV